MQQYPARLAIVFDRVPMLALGFARGRSADGTERWNPSLPQRDK
jgi:hypothetical protein